MKFLPTLFLFSCLTFVSKEQINSLKSVHDFPGKSGPELCQKAHEFSVINFGKDSVLLRPDFVAGTGSIWSKWGPVSFGYYFLCSTGKIEFGIESASNSDQFGNRHGYLVEGAFEDLKEFFEKSDLDFASK